MTRETRSEPILARIGERFSELFDLYEGAGRRLYLVGGCVRDALLGVVERSDFDFATDALPEESLRLLRQAGLRTFPIGARFGTVAALVDGTVVEITTFRVKEEYEEGNRKPQVEFGESLEDDLSRRDLSINAMAMDRSGQLIDPFGGREALEARILEVPRGGVENTCSILRDDPLRLLRIARFAGRLGFRPTDGTTVAAERCSDGLLSISRERWKMEMDKLLVTRHVRTGLAWLARTGGLEVILPESAGLVALGQVERVGTQLAEAERDERVRWALLVLHAVVSSSSGGRLDVRGGVAAWPGEEERAQAALAVASRFRFSNEERTTHCRLVGTPMGPLELDAVDGRPALRRFSVQYLDDADRALSLFEALADTLPDGAERVDRVRRELWALRAVEDPVPRLPKGVGHALLEAFEIKRGPLLALVMGRLREAVIEEGLPNPPTAEQCVAHVRAHPELLADAPAAS